MMRRHALRIGVPSVGLVAGVLAGCSTDSASTAPEPSCADRRIAEASAYRYDPAGAIAVAHGIAESHPELQGIVDAVADHQRRRPDTERMIITDRRAMPAEVSFAYTMVLVNLAARAELATPGAIALVEEAATSPDDAADAGDRGMLGIYLLMTDSERLLDASDRQIFELSHLVDRQTEAVEDAGVGDIRWTECARPHEG